LKKQKKDGSSRSARLCPAAVSQGCDEREALENIKDAITAEDQKAV